MDTMTTFITKEEQIEIEAGLNNIYDDITDCTDLQKTRANLGIKEWIKKVYMITSEDHPDFKNKQNKDVAFWRPVFIDTDLDGTYIYSNRYGDSNLRYYRRRVTDHPIGKVYILVDTDLSNRYGDSNLRYSYRCIS